MIVVLVEGESDRAAVQAMADRATVPLDEFTVVAAGGAMNFGNHLAELVDGDHRLAGLVDVNEAPVVAMALVRLGIAADADPAGLAAHGFFTCDRDLEDELIRALGTERVLGLLAEQNELAPFRTFQSQLAWRGRPLPDQLHRFLGIRAGRKIRYGRLLVEALEPDVIPSPLAGLLDCLVA
jgi:hypothetical protein